MQASNFEKNISRHTVKLLTCNNRNNLLNIFSQFLQQMRIICMHYLLAFLANKSSTDINLVSKQATILDLSLVFCLHSVDQKKKEG
jgi:hypothetical protein